MQVRKEGKNLVFTDGENQGLLRTVDIAAKCVKPQHELRRHERYALRQGYPTLKIVPPHEKVAVLVGSGPSINDHVEDIRELARFNTTVAIKGAHDWMRNHKIPFQMAVAVDPQEKSADLYRNPDYAAVYFIASQCHPKTFQALKDHRVVLWHLYTKSAHQYWTERKKKGGPDLLFLTGGSTTGLRAITLLYAMGYRKFHLFGYDSCLRDGLLKVTGERTPEDRQLITVIGQNTDHPRPFVTDGAMACQVGEFKKQLMVMGDAQVKCWGDGAIQYFAHTEARMGNPKFLLPDETFGNLNSKERGTVVVHAADDDQQVKYSER